MDIVKSSSRYCILQSKSWNSRTKPPEKGDRRQNKSKKKSGSGVAPEGCFSVYVGSEKQRFVIKTKHANQPLFRILLEYSELEYGYDSKGPIVIPCDVNLFREVLAEMENEQIGCRITAYGSCTPFSLEAAS